MTEGTHTFWVPIGSGPGRIQLPPPSQVGSYFLVAKADPDNLIAEASETNNEAAISPDIKVSNVHFNGSTQSIAFDLATRDINDNYTVKLYQSSSATFNPATAVERGSMTVGAKQLHGIFNIHQPLNVQAGNYLFVVANPLDPDHPEKQLFETNAQNNAALCAPDIEVSQARYNSATKEVTVDYTVWNTSSSFNLWLYQINANGKRVEPYQVTASATSNQRTFKLFTAPIRENGQSMCVVADPEHKIADNNWANNTVWLDLAFPPEKPDPVIGRKFQIRIVSGVEVPVLGAALEMIDFEIQHVLDNGKLGPVQKFSYTGIGAGLGLPVGGMKQSDWVSFETLRSMSFADFQGAGAIGSGPSGGVDSRSTDTVMGLWFKDAKSLFGTFVPFKAGGSSSGATLVQGTVGRWVML